MQYHRRHHHLVFYYAVIATILFTALAIAVVYNPILPGDVQITRAIQSFRTPWLDVIMQAIGLPGSPPQTLFLNFAVIVIVFLCRMYPEALTLLVFIPGYGTVGTLIRCGIDRPRPIADLVFVMDTIKDRGCSFPSGHTANFIVISGFLIVVGLKYLPVSWHRNLLLSLHALFIVFMGVSRIYVGDHWPSDVLGGALLGSIFLVSMVEFYEWVQRRFFARSRLRQGAGP